MSAESGLRAELSTAVGTDDVPDTGRCRDAVVSHLEGGVDDTGTDAFGNLSVPVATQITSELYRVEVVVRPAVRRPCCLPGVDLCPASDDDGRTGVGVADNDDEQDTVTDQCEAPSVGRVPAQLTGTNRFGDNWKRDVSPRLSEASTEMIGESVRARVAKRNIPRRAP